MPRTVCASVGGACEDSLERSKAPCPIFRDEQDDWVSFALACACIVLAFLALGTSRAAAQLGPAVPPAAASSGEGRESSSPGSSPATQGVGGPDARHFDGLVRPFFARYCLDCHGGEKPKGDLRLDQLAPDFVDEAGRERWRDVLERLDAGTMPPKAKPRPPERDVRALSDWITGRVAAANAERRVTQGRVVLRRLNRIEYDNTVRDLLGVDANLKELLPLDISADGFDNVGHALHMSSFLMDKYLEAADTALNQAIASRPRPPTIKKRYSLTETRQAKSAQEHVFRERDDGGVVLFADTFGTSTGTLSGLDAVG